MKSEQGTRNRKPETGNFRKGDDIARRLLGVGARVVLLARALPKDAAGRHIAGQVLRSSTSGGANYEEARAAESAADFIHKLRIAAKELRESIYWLKLIEAAQLSEHVAPLIAECNELVAILV